MFKIKLWVAFFSGWILLHDSSNLHEYYVSSTDILYLDEKKQVQITTYIFIDDMEDYLNSRSDFNIQLQPDNRITEVDSLIQVFFKNNFKLRFDKKFLKIKYLGREYKEDQLLIFAQVNRTNKPKSFEITNTILTSFRKGQQNIVHLKSENSRKSFLMDASKTILTQFWFE
tara:strand:- start:2133 stop:2645 length:513 start_codon:yes stop_codon:yes gene_type:complete